MRSDYGEAATTYTLAAAGATQGLWRYGLRDYLNAGRGWAAVAGLVVAYELACPNGETLSEGADRAIEKHPIATTALIGMVALHLVNAIPERYDPLHKLTKLR